MEDSYDIFKFRGSTNKLSLKLNCPTKLNEESATALGVTTVSSSSDSELDSGLSGDDSGVARRRRYCHCLALCITVTQYQFSRHNGHKKKMAATRLLTKSKGEDKEGLGEDLEADTLETPPSKRCCKSTVHY